jgi:hypothetical protein
LAKEVPFVVLPSARCPCSLCHALRNQNAPLALVEPGAASGEQKHHGIMSYSAVWT